MCNFVLLNRNDDHLYMKTRHYLLILGGGILLALLGATYYFFLTPFNNSDTAHTIFIDRDDTSDSITIKLSDINTQKVGAFKLLWAIKDCTPRPGKYEVTAEQSVVDIFRMFRNGQQVPTKLIINPAWTVEIMASRLAPQLMVDSAELVSFFNDSTTLELMNCTKETLPAHFIPNTYEVYWTITPKQLVVRMEKEYQSFWTTERRAKAEKLGLSLHDVSTLASIVCRETNNTTEMPIIAGLYLNRLRKNMPLQACPTVIFARQDFSIRRLTDPMNPDNAYNTYRYAGLPPGPIFIAPISAIDAVLNAQSNNYIYMCAKEDFSGTHNFASSYAEHQRNAVRYQKAFKERFGNKK